MVTITKLIANILWSTNDKIMNYEVNMNIFTKTDDELIIFVQFLIDDNAILYLE